MTEKGKQRTTLSGRGFTPPSPINRQAAIRSAGEAARAAKSEKIGDLDDGGTLTIRYAGRRYLGAYGVENGMIAVTVLHGGRWRTKAPTGLQGSPALTVARMIASEIVSEASRDAS